MENILFKLWNLTYGIDRDVKSVIIIDISIILEVKSMFKRISVLFLTLVMVFCWILPVSAAGTFKLKYSYANNAEITE